MWALTGALSSESVPAETPCYKNLQKNEQKGDSHKVHYTVGEFKSRKGESLVVQREGEPNANGTQIRTTKNNSNEGAQIRKNGTLRCAKV